MEPYRNMTCVLKVDTQSPGWEKSLTKVIKQIKDVSYTIDATHGIIRISGAMDPNKLLMDIQKAGKHAELLAADIGSSSGGGGGGGSGHLNSNHGNRYGYNQNDYNGNHDRGYHYNEYNGNYGRGYGYNEYNGGYGNVVPSYNHIQYQYDPYRSNGVSALPAPSAPEQLQHQQLQHYYDTNHNCVIM